LWQTYQALLNENDTGRLETEFGDKTQQAFLVDKADIASNKYDLSINRYKETNYVEEEFDQPVEILARLKKLESEIMDDFKALEGMV
jgi:type I restriction enzyme M protein